MKSNKTSFIATFSLATFLTIPILAGPSQAKEGTASELETFQGKWSAPRTSDNGQPCTHQLEISKNKFTFRILDADNQTKLLAQGEVKLDKTGPFQTIVFSNIKAGGSKAELDEIDDTYTAIYKFGEDGSMLLVTNFDKDRENQKPSLDVYKKATQALK
ncbi:MAG: hypothetical protein C5B50_27745 [Verrucomicrobia bacterium]|nr:MAG: hypothetical protein C5B50_27745 [Verrucomicrobiota bacterium]